MVSIGLAFTLDPSMPSVTGAANVTGQVFVNVFAATYNGFSLMTILPIVLIMAVLLISLLACFKCFAASGAAE
jgi:hypothetical protein